MRFKRRQHFLTEFAVEYLVSLLDRLEQIRNIEYVETRFHGREHARTALKDIKFTFLDHFDHLRPCAKLLVGKQLDVDSPLESLLATCAISLAPTPCGLSSKAGLLPTTLASR